MSADKLAEILLGMNTPNDRSWKFHKVRRGDRRPLFLVHDILKFERPTGSTNTLTVTVWDSTKRPVLGEPLELTYAAATSGLGDYRATAYGREIRFMEVSGKLYFEADYKGGPWNHPDESGDGDPTVDP